MKPKTRKIAFTSFVLAAMLLLCALFPLIPLKKSASAQNNPIDSTHEIAYIMQDERTAVPDNFLALNYTQYDEIILEFPDNVIYVASTLNNCSAQNYDIVILDFEYGLYDGYTVIDDAIEDLCDHGIPVILIHTRSTDTIQTLSYYPCLTAAISVNEWANDGFDLLLGKMAESIFFRYNTSTTVNIIVDYEFYHEYFLLRGNEGKSEFLNWVISALYAYNIYDYRLIIQTGNGVATDDFLIIEPTDTTYESEYTESMKTFPDGGSICNEYPGYFCGMTTIPFSSYTYDYFKEIYESGYGEFNAYGFISRLSLHFGGKPPFPYGILGTDIIIPPDDIDNGSEGDDIVPQDIENKRIEFGEYLLSIINKIFDDEVVEKSTYFLYI